VSPDILGGSYLENASDTSNPNVFVAIDFVHMYVHDRLGIKLPISFNVVYRIILKLYLFIVHEKTCK